MRTMSELAATMASVASVVALACLTVACGGTVAPAGDAGVDAPPGADGGAPDAPAADAPPVDAPGPDAPAADSGVAGVGYFVALTGSDTSGDGTAGNPWRTIDHALSQVSGGDLILVRPGTYDGRVHLDEAFATPVTVRAEVPYQVRLRHTDTVVTCNYGQGIVLEGFDIAHAGPGAGALVVQIQDLRGTQPGCADGDCVSRITLRNNVIHDSYDNDILKINNGAADVLVEGNMLYNQNGSDEQMDINSVTDVIIQDNVLFNDFAGSGRANLSDTSGFVVIKDSNGTSDSNLGALRITVRRNVFLHWEGGTGHGFVQVGEDATANYEAQQVLIENNLMIGDGTDTMRAAFAVMGSNDITFRNNSVVGDLPSLAWLRVYRVGANQPSNDIFIYNNVFADTGGTMDDFSDSPPGEVARWALASNLYWNDGAAIPASGAETINYTDDAARVLGDPCIGAPGALVVPRWSETAGQFADGSATIRAAFLGLVARHGTPGACATVDAADPTRASAEDILGRARGAAPDLGALER